MNHRCRRLVARRAPAAAQRSQDSLTTGDGGTLSGGLAPDNVQRMPFQNTEDRLNPIAPETADESTLGGYAQVHGRAAAFEGCDGRPYTAAVEVEAGDGTEASWVAYFVFLRWADTGTAIMGHLETGDLASGENEEEARSALESLPLTRVKQILDEAIRQREAGDPKADGS
jgi:hypothetical protein